MEKPNTILDEASKKIFNEFLKSEYDSCMMCNGYYGNNFGQPVCTTCHLFLFSINLKEDDEDREHRGYEKVDSDDSGTEEPGAEADFYSSNEVRDGERQPCARRPARVLARADRLAERINALTTPREKDTVPEGLIDSLPPEVLLLVFKNLDDISKWVASNVCSRWQQILEGEITQAQWMQFIRRRWPLFQPQLKVRCWKTIYSQLLLSSPCRHCLEGMMLQSTPPIEENSWRHRRLRSELKTLKTDPPEGIQAAPLDSHCCHWQASITGPQGSPYEGGLFLLYLQIPQNYPMWPPKVRFLTKIFHPNISRHGDLGLDSLHHNWSLALTISKVLVSVQSLLTDPYLPVCMEPSVGKLFRDHPQTFERMARLSTWKYAMHDYVGGLDINLNDI